MIKFSLVKEKGKKIVSRVKYNVTYSYEFDRTAGIYTVYTVNSYEILYLTIKLIVNHSRL